ncbi:COPI associated protein [Nitzschia inconspicua]|uniref:COPI associated protein n=1 Tax=Nitzschia inconspicua TaxID=303405 RepID=A0A9K3Q437_9STRA|nr:COPI associated protein [Nitzschia inconspicua]
MLSPLGSAPAAPPPPPPASDSSVSSAASGASPYQKQQPSTASKAPVPTITNYGLSPQQIFYESGGSAQHNNYSSASSGTVSNSTVPRVRGDVTIRPNTGNTNQESGAAFGSLREIASALRWMTITTTITAIFWEGFAFPMRIISTAFVQPSKVVLGAYLGVFCLLILGVEMNAPLRDNFGFLYNPMTRGMVLLMMSSMCIGILKSWWESLLGIAFVVVGLGYVYTYIKYPEYRRWQDYNQNRPSAWQDLRHYWMNNTEQGRRSSSVWADPDSVENRSSWNSIYQTTSSEARVLLHNV